MDRFHECLTVILNNEGGLSNNPRDTGGMTNFGVTQSVYDDFRIASGLPQQPVSGITLAEATSIYYSNYWLPSRCSALPAPVDLCMFDAAVNSGVGRAAKWLQQAVSVTQDGSIGPATLAAVSSTDTVILCGKYCTEREAFVRSVVAANPSQKIFLNGWLNRINHIRSLCGVSNA